MRSPKYSVHKALGATSYLFPNLDHTHTMATMSFNIPLLSIPAYFILASYPHAHAMMVIAKAHMQKHDNSNPKGAKATESLKKRLSAREFAAYERAESCHRNHLENMPLFVAAIFAGLLAEQTVGAGAVGLTNFAVGWMVIRVLYTISYLRTEDVKWSYFRSVVYNVGSFWALYVIGKAAFVFGA